MFERAVCFGLHRAERPMVDCATLLRLKALLSAAADETVIEARHRSSHLQGDADTPPDPASSQVQLDLFRPSRREPNWWSLLLQVREQARHLLATRHEKARRGELIVAAPVGYVKAEGSSPGSQCLERDPDRRVQAAIAQGI